MENEKGLWTAKDTASHIRYSYGTFRNKLAAEVKDNIPSEKSELLQDFKLRHHCLP